MFKEGPEGFKGGLSAGKYSKIEPEHRRQPQRATWPI
jgi:hypothetical protein